MSAEEEEKCPLADEPLPVIERAPPGVVNIENTHSGIPKIKLKNVSKFKNPDPAQV